MRNGGDIISYAKSGRLLSCRVRAEVGLSFIERKAKSP